MLNTIKSRNHIRIYNLRSTNRSSRSSRTQGLYKKAAFKLNRNLRNRNKNETSKRQHSALKLTELLDKELITEIQYTSKNKFCREVVKNISNLNLDRSMEWEDEGTLPQKVVKTVKFEQYLSSKNVPKSTKNPKFSSALQNYLKSKIARNQKSRGSKSRGRNTSSHSRKRRTMVRDRQIVKQLENKLKLGKYDSRDTEFSRPSSVTSLFTACSAGNYINSHKFGSTLDLINTVKHDSAIPQADLYREVVEYIEESDYLPTGHQHRSERPALRSRSRTKIAEVKNMSLISEIQSELENSKEMSLDECNSPQKITSIVRAAKRQSRKVKFEMVYFKNTMSDPATTVSSTTSEQNLNFYEKSYKCFAESDVLNFKDCENATITHDFNKGDDDEDSDEEDIKYGKKHLQLNLEKTLVELLKRNKKSAR